MVAASVLSCFMGFDALVGSSVALDTCAGVWGLSVEGEVAWLV